MAQRALCRKLLEKDDKLRLNTRGILAEKIVRTVVQEFIDHGGHIKDFKKEIEECVTTKHGDGEKAGAGGGGGVAINVATTCSKVGGATGRDTGKVSEEPRDRLLRMKIEKGKEEEDKLKGSMMKKSNVKQNSENCLHATSTMSTKQMTPGSRAQFSPAMATLKCKQNHRYDDECDVLSPPGMSVFLSFGCAVECAKSRRTL
jgi:hypothetical protein